MAQSRNPRWQTGCSPRPPTLTQRYVRRRGCSGRTPSLPSWISRHVHVHQHFACMPGGLREVVLSFKFRQNRFRDVGVEICHFLYQRPVAYITACTIVQAVLTFRYGFSIYIPNLVQKCSSTPNMAQNRNPRRRPSAILELLHHHIGPPTKFFQRVTSACQILCLSDA